MTPPSAPLPQSAEPPPRMTSICAMPSGGNRLHCTQPPKGSLIGTPSMRTSARLAPLGPMPRSDTPCAVGCVTRLEERRNKLNDGT